MLKRRILSLFVASALLAGMLPTMALASTPSTNITTPTKDLNSGQVMYTSLAKTPYMKSLKPKWDLKAGKSYKVKVTVGNVGVKTLGNISISKPNIKKIKKGKKKVTFNMTFERTYNPSKSDLKKWSKWEADYFYSGDYYVTAVDYETGKALGGEFATSKGVSFSSKWTNIKDKTFKFKGGYNKQGKWSKTQPNAVVLNTKKTCKITITMPADYKGLCIGIGNWDSSGFGVKGDGYTAFAPYSNNFNDFCKGKTPLGSKEFYSHYKTSSHWMRIK